MGKCCDCEKTDLETLMDLHFFSVFWNDITLYMQQLGLILLILLAYFPYFEKNTIKVRF
jgi:hypothetical protein